MKIRLCPEKFALMDHVAKISKSESAESEPLFLCLLLLVKFA